MGETLKNWAKKYESGSTKELPEWIPTDELPFWEQFLRIHPELIEPTERKTSLAKKLANGRPLTPNILLEFGVDTIDKFLEYMGRAVGCVSKALNSIRSASIRNRDLRFTSLFHHINEPLLTEAFNKLRKEAAPGCDRKDEGGCLCKMDPAQGVFRFIFCLDPGRSPRTLMGFIPEK